MRNVFITGAAGFIGAWITRAALQRGWQVTATDKRAPNPALACLGDEVERGNLRRHVLDVTDEQAVTQAIADVSPDSIIHLAAMLIPACKDQPSRAAAVNVGGFVNVLEAARGACVSNIVYASSAAAAITAPINVGQSFMPPRLRLSMVCQPSDFAQPLCMATVEKRALPRLFRWR